MADNLPKTQEESRSVIAQRIKDTVDAWNAATRAGDKTQATQLFQQYKDLNKQFEAAKQGTSASIGSGLLSGVRQNFDFMGKGFQQAAPTLSLPSRVAETVLNYRFGRPVNEPQSQEQLVPFRSGQAVGSIAAGLLTPGNTAKSVATAAGLSAADIGIESQGGPQAAASLGYLAAVMGRSGWKGMKNWREGRKFENLMSNLPEDMPELEKNALKRFMLTGQGSDNGIVAAAMQRLETKPQFAEMISKLREGATEQTLSGMRPDVGKLTKEQTSTGFIQTLQNKLDGLKETVATSLFDTKRLSLYDKAKGYGGNQGIVDPTNTLANIDQLIKEFKAKKTPDAENSVKALEAIRERFQPTQSAVYGAQPSSTFVVREGTQGFTTPTHPGGVRIVEEQVPTFDSLGTPTGYKTVRKEVPFSSIPGATVPGTPATMGTRPASSGTKVTWQTAPEKLTVEEVQGALSEFGKKATQGDSLLKDVSISSEQRISAAIFGGMKDDIRTAISQDKDPNNRKALTLLNDARQQTATAVSNYNDAVAQGLPNFLKDKSPSSLNFDTLVSEYEKLNPQQRASVRQLVGDTDPEVLKQFDRQVYTNFLDKARDSDGKVDLNKLTTLWNSTKVQDRDAVITALGVNAGEFTARMRDATAFNNRIRVAQPAAEPSTITEAAPSAARLAGTTLGYGAHQGVMLSADIAKQLLDKTKLTDEQFMKLFLSPEGADFLKTQKMTPGSTKLLEDLTKVTAPPTVPIATVQQAGSSLQEQPTQTVAPVQPPQQQQKETPAFVMPDEEATAPQQQPAFQMVD